MNLQLDFMKTRFRTSKLLLFLLSLCLLNSCRPAPSDQTRSRTNTVPPALDPAASGIKISQSGGPLKRYDQIHISFPTDMIEPSLVEKARRLQDEGGVHMDLGAAPVVMEPDPGVRFEWLSPRRGVLHTPSNIPDVSYRLTLRPGLEDRSGQPVKTENWGAEWQSDGFGLSNVELVNFATGERDAISTLDESISQLPHFRLEFTRDVWPEEIAARAAFVDAETNERFPAVARLDDWQKDTAQGLVFLHPKDLLPPERRYLLVIERLKAARPEISQDEPLQTDYLRVYPAGFCAPMRALSARGYNQPNVGRFARIYFNQRPSLASRPGDFCQVTPAVPDLSARIERNSIVLTGKFEREVEYTVVTKPGVMSRGGARSSQEFTFTFGIPDRRPAVILAEDFLAQKFSDGIDISLSLCRIKEMNWRLAAVSVEHIAGVRDRLREFAEPLINENGSFQLDTLDGSLMFQETSPLIDDFALPVVASGQLEGAPEEEAVDRRVQWKPTSPGQNAGLYLIEFEGVGTDGRRCGNRSLITLSDWFVNAIATTKTLSVRVTSMATGESISGVSVQAFKADGDLLDQAVTDSTGMADFPVINRHLKTKESWDDPLSPSFLLVGNDKGRFYQEGNFSPVPGDWRNDESDATANERLTGVLTTNGDIFQPSEVVKLHVLVRQEGREGLPPSLDFPLSDPPFTLNIVAGSQDEPDFELELPVKLDPDGSASITWSPPSRMEPARVFFSLVRGGRPITSTDVSITHFRLPSFSLSLNTPDSSGDEAVAEVRSAFFHGSANKKATVQWTAEWVLHDWLEYDLPEYFEDRGDFGAPGSQFTHMGPAQDSLAQGYQRLWDPFLWDEFSFTDRYSPASGKNGTASLQAHLGAQLAFGGIPQRTVPASQPSRGVAELDENGHLRIVSKCPFSTGKGLTQNLIHRAKVLWTVDVKTEAGVSRRAVADQKIQFPQHALALAADAGEPGEEGISVRLTAIDVHDQEQGRGEKAEVELLHRSLDTTVESVTEHLLRYHNQARFESLQKLTVTLPFSGTLATPRTGDYVVCAKLLEGDDSPLVSQQVTGVKNLTDLAVINDTHFEAVLEQASVNVGTSAFVKARTPFPGCLHVSIEAGQVIERLPPINMTGTETRVEIPVRKSHYPNAFIRLYLTQAGEAGDAPAERTALCALKVRDPNVELSVKVEPTAVVNRVRDTVRGKVTVFAGTDPAANASVQIFAIDEAVLSLGNWTLPNLKAVYYHDRVHRVRFNTALGSHWHQRPVSALSQFEKGYVLGANRDKVLLPTVILRENANPRPLWSGQIKTNESGEAPFEFVAPDSLTSYRINVIAHTSDARFGTGDGLVRITNPLRIEPYLPTFIREQDELTLRCDLTQDHNASLPVRFEVSVEGPATLVDDVERVQQLAVVGGQSNLVTVRLRAGILDAPHDQIRLRFNATATDGSNLADAVGKTLVLLPRHQERTEILSGHLETGQELNIPSLAKPEWTSQPGGKVDVYLSGTRWLPQLLAFTPRPPHQAILCDLAATACTPYVVTELAEYLPWPNSPAGNLVTAQTSLGALPLWFQEEAEKQARVAAALIENTVIPDGPAGWMPKFLNQPLIDDPNTALVNFAVELSRQTSETQNNEEQEGGESSDDEAEDETTETPAQPVILPDRPFIPPIWSQRLTTMLANWRRSATRFGMRPKDLPEPTPFVMSLALLAEAGSVERYGMDTEELKAAAKYLYDYRDRDPSLEWRCFLALAIREIDGKLEEEAMEESGGVATADQIPTVLNDTSWKTLLSEIRTSNLPTAFDGATLSTTQRAAAVRLYTLATVAGAESLEVSDLATDAVTSSPQETIWSLLATNAMLRHEKPALLADNGQPLFGPAHAAISGNGVSLGWFQTPAANLPGTFSSPIRPNLPSTWAIKSTFRAALTEPRSSQGLGVTREIARHQGNDFTADNEGFQIGDYVLITYTVKTDSPLTYLLVQDDLPAALEPIDTDLPAFQQAFKLPPANNEAKLSHIWREPHRVRLTFESISAGESTYSVPAQIVASGSFAWPAAGVSLLYNPALSATTADAKFSAKH